MGNKKVSTPVHSLTFHISDTEAYELVDKMKTLEDLTSAVHKREGIIITTTQNVEHLILCTV